MKNYKQELIKRYYSTHHKYFTPKTMEEWNMIIDGIELNFGDIFFSISKDSAILDVACGVGYLEYYLLKKGFTRIYAIDLSEEQINIAKKKLKEYGLNYNHKIIFEISDAFEYLRKGNKFDVIAMIDFLEHFSKNEIIELLELSYSALNNDGFFIVRAINADNPLFGRFFYGDFTHETPFTPDSIRQCCNLVGFKVIRIDYEKILIKKIKGSLIFLKQFKKAICSLGIKILSKFLGINPEAFSGNLIVVSKK